MIVWLSTNDKNGGGPWQSGWKEHAVEVPNDKVNFGSLKRQASLCGLRPRRGWGIDLFIDTKCKRCCKVLAKLSK